MSLQIAEITETANTDTRHFLAYLNANLERNKELGDLGCKAILSEALQNYKSCHERQIALDETLQHTIELLEMCLGCSQRQLNGFLQLAGSL